MVRNQPSIALITSDSWVRRCPSRNRSSTRRPAVCAITGVGVDGRQHPVQSVVVGNAMTIGHEPAQEGELLPAPELDLDAVIGAGQREAVSNKRRISDRE
jgi:hypothetical protein